jgi:hypothetical protein
VESQRRADDELQRRLNQRFRPVRA